MPPGELGSYAEWQLGHARNDPRPGREGAHLADASEYFDEADRVRILAIGAIEALADIDPSLEQEPEAQKAAWERREMARAEMNAEHPHLNGLTLVGMFSNIDGLVERLLPNYRTARIDWQVDAFVAHLTDRLGDGNDVDPKLLEALRAAIRDDADKELPKPRRLEGAAPHRWERELRRAGLAAPASRPIPPAMSETLQEITALRNVLVHQAGRVHSDAVQMAPSLKKKHGLEVGSFIRIDRIGYRRYSAALRAYGNEVHARVLAIGLGDTAYDGFDLTDWADMHYLGA